MNYLQKELYDLIKSDDTIFDFIQESSLDGLWYWDLEKPEEEWMNPKFWTTLGYDPAEMPHKAATWRDIINQEDLQSAIERVTKHIQDPTFPYDQVIRYTHKKGHTVWIECRGIAIRDAAGKAIRVLGAHHDITTQKEAEQKAFKDAEFYKTILQNQSAYIIKIDLAGNYTYLNEVYAAGFGYDTKEFIGKSSTIGMHEEDISKAAAIGQKCINELHIIHRERLRKVLKNSEIRITAWEFKALIDQKGEVNELLCIGVDITEQVEAEEAIKKSEHSLIQAQRLAKIGSWQFDLQNNDLTWSEEHYRIFEIDVTIPKEELYEAYQAKIHPEDLKELDKIVCETIPQGKSYLYNHRVLRSDGSIKYVLGRGEPVFDEQGNPIGSRGTVQDVTEQKQAEVEIQKVTTLLNNAQRIANLGGWELDLSTGKTLWTDEIYTIHEIDRGFDHNKINGIAFYHPDYQETIINAIKNTIQTQEPFDETCRFITAKGNYRWVRASGQAIIEDGKVTKLVGMFQDISKEKEAAQSLIRTQKMLTQTNKVARIGGWEFDIENSQIYWSDMMCHIHEIPIDTSLGIEMAFNFYEQESRERLLKAYKKAIQTEGSSYDLELKIITAKGNPVCVRAIGITEFKEGKCIKVYGTFQDITEQKQAQAEINTQKELLNTIITDLQEGLSIVNTEGAIIKVNKAFCQMTGYSEEELIGLIPPFPHWPEDSISETQEVFQKALTGNLNESFELTFQRKNGELFPAIIKPRSVKNTEGQILYMFKTVRDISEQRQYENNLLQAKKNAEAANKAKSEFLANMSHEIRTPLNGVIGFTDLLMKTELNAFQKEYMQTVFQSANSLLDIINDILDFSKIEAGKLELSITKVDILELMGQITDMVRPQIHKKGLEMLLDIPINCPRFIWVDGMRLRQILVNLLSNAIKFTKNGEIELRVKVLEEVNPQATKLSFSIRDTGIGIAPENQQKIFEAFSQEDASTTRRFGGTGLGLSISNNLLKLMDTHLRLKSQVGEGSTFYFEINTPSEKGEPYQWNIETIKKILVVDDNENNLRIVKDMLSKFDIEVQLVQNGFDALGKLQKGERFDVIFMDYHMPIMDGIATVRSIRQVLNISAEEQSVIFLHSSMDDEELRKIFKELGVIQYLAKPLQINTLFRTLHKLKNPAMDALPQETVQEIDTNPIIATPTVLIVDDNHVNLLLAKSLVNFLLKDVNIIQANDGKEAIDMYLQHKPTLILMDIQMPEMNGYEASEAIRVLEKGKNVPIIALTAGTVKGERERCLEAGMNDYLSKPIVSEDLGVALKKWLLQTEILVKDTNIQSVENADIQIKHFDKEFLLERIHQDTDLLQVILEEGRKYLGNIWSVLYEQVKNEDWKSIHQTAHQLKGVSLSSCFPRLAELASEIEDLEEYEKNNIDRLIHSLEIEIEVVMGLIADELVR